MPTNVCTGTGTSLEAVGIEGENHLLEITLSRDGTSYTGGRERKKRKGGGTGFLSCFAWALGILLPPILLLLHLLTFFFLSPLLSTPGHWAHRQSKDAGCPSWKSWRASKSSQGYFDLQVAVSLMGHVTKLCGEEKNNPDLNCLFPGSDRLQGWMDHKIKGIGGGAVCVCMGEDRM